MSNELSYNGYTFGDRSHILINAEMVEDDAGRTVVYHRYKIHVQTTIIAEGGDANVGSHFKRIRQLLSKAGGVLVINHAGFGPRLAINGGAGATDVAFGPKPKIIAWDPIGNTNAVEVTWECETCIPTCDGYGGARFQGLAALNYGVSYKIDKKGFTTRTVSGYLEIAMTRNGRSIPDTADAYRELIVTPKPENFERETQWNISLDKRRADFTITDSEIASPNDYPFGVVKIDAEHYTGWTRRSSQRLNNTISASITLAANQPRGRAWDIFRAIVSQRVGFGGQKTIFIQGLEVRESLYDYAINFSMSYTILAGVAEIFVATGLFSDLPGNWQAWAASMADVQTHRGQAKLRNSAQEDQIVDLCASDFLPSVPTPYYVQKPPLTTYQRFCNKKPPPYESWLRFEGGLSTVEEVPTVEQITIGKDDLRARDFDPADPLGTNGETDQSKNIERYIESAPSNMEFIWEGYAERVGYDIPRPNKLKFGNVTLVRKGKQEFRKKFLGLFFCQPLYGASWRMRYVVDERPAAVDAKEADPVNESAAT